ncbi:MAG: hypothetical protein M3Z64_03870 [Verrucomicrobiota bacterium]|nr:hypothetical protein [Verrucomicrobiota bacterium]
MHKNPVPSIFDIAARSLRYTVGLGLVIGFILSIFVHVGLLLWRADTGTKQEGSNDPNALEASMTARRRSPPPAPEPTAGVRY